jgi:hypothetical protein
METDKIKALVDLDSARLVETMTGHPLDERTNLIAAAVQMEKSHVQRNVMIDVGDFLFSDTWERRQSLLRRYGWTEVQTLSCPVHPDRQVEEASMPDVYGHTLQALLHFWVHTDGLVFVQNRVQVKRGGPEPHMYLGHGHCYFAWVPTVPGKPCPISFSGRVYSQGNPGWSGLASLTDTLPIDLVTVGSFSTSDGLFWVHENAKKTGRFLNPWPEFAFESQDHFVRHEREIAVNGPWTKQAFQELRLRHWERLQTMPESIRSIVGGKKPTVSQQPPLPLEPGNEPPR